MEAVRKNDIISAFRIALAISVLKTHERGAFSSLVLSMAGRELGDLRLSGLLALSTYLAESALKELSDSYAAEMQSTVLTRIQLVNFGCAPTANGAAATTAQPQSTKSAFLGTGGARGLKGMMFVHFISARTVGTASMPKPRPVTKGILLVSGIQWMAR